MSHAHRQIDEAPFLAVEYIVLYPDFVPAFQEMDGFMSRVVDVQGRTDFWKDVEHKVIQNPISMKSGKEKIKKRNRLAVPDFHPLSNQDLMRFFPVHNSRSRSIGGGIWSS